MTEYTGPTLLVVFVVALAVTALARRWSISAPLVLVVAGLAISFVPGVPSVPLDPDLVLFLVLPPLLYSAALESSTLRLRENLRRISQLAVGLVVFTTAVVGVAAWLLVPGLPLASALVLGAVVAPPDAVAGTPAAMFDRRRPACAKPTGRRRRRRERTAPVRQRSATARPSTGRSRRDR